jgi:hypothetical protein
MRLYALYTPSHEVLAEEWFLPSLRDDYDLRVESQAQRGPKADHRYGTAAFNRTTLAKVELILQAIEDNWNDPFVFSDVDVQFFQPTREALDASIRGRDISFQQNQINGEINTGFFACRGNERTRSLWAGVKATMRDHPEWNDQDALNHLMFRRYPALLQKHLLQPITQHRLAPLALRGLPTHRVAHVLPFFHNEFGVRWRYLPIEFFTTGMKRGTDWQPGQDLRIPKGIVMHHANFCVGAEAKIQQLKEVRRLVASRQVH